MPTREQLIALTRQLTAQGKLVEVGWIGLLLALRLEHVSDLQRDEMRKAFFAGAAHLFSSIVSMLDPGSEPSAADLRRMSQIHEELERFEEQLKAELRAAARPPSAPS